MKFTLINAFIINLFLNIFISPAFSVTQKSLLQEIKDIK